MAGTRTDPQWVRYQRNSIKPMGATEHLIETGVLPLIVPLRPPALDHDTGVLSLIVPLHPPALDHETGVPSLIVPLPCPL